MSFTAYLPFSPPKKIPRHSQPHMGNPAHPSSALEPFRVFGTVPRYSWAYAKLCPMTTQNIGSVLVKSPAIHARLRVVTTTEIRRRYSARKTGRY